MAVKWEERKDPRDEVAWTSLGMSRQVNIHLDSTLEIIRSNFMFIRSLAKLPKEVLNIPLRHKPGYLLTAICRVSMVQWMENVPIFSSACSLNSPRKVWLRSNETTDSYIIGIG